MTFFEFAATMLALCVLLGAASYLIELFSYSERVRSCKPALIAMNIIVGPLILCSAICGAIGVLAVSGGVMNMFLPLL